MSASWLTQDTINNECVCILGSKWENARIQASQLGLLAVPGQNWRKQLAFGSSTATTTIEQRSCFSQFIRNRDIKNKLNSAFRKDEQFHIEINQWTYHGSVRKQWLLPMESISLPQARRKESSRFL